MAKPYAIVWAKDRWTGFIIEDECNTDDDVASWVGDYDYEIVKLEYTGEKSEKDKSYC